MQRRYFNYGVDATASLFKEMLEGLTGKGVLSGASLGVSGNDRLLVGPFWAALSSPRSTALGMTQTALLVNETETTTLLVPTTTAAASYTVLLSHDDTDVVGGAAASVTLQTGLLKTENISNGVVLAWVLYPGGSVPLANAHLIQAPQHRLEAVSTAGDGNYLVAPFSNMLTLHSAGDIAIISNYEDADVGAALKLDNQTNTPTTPSIDLLRWTFVAGAEPPASITLDYVENVNTTILSFDIQDTEGNKGNQTSSPSLYPIPRGQYLAGMLTSDFSSDVVLETYQSGSLRVRRKRLRITNGTFQPGKRFRIQAAVRTTNGGISLITGCGHSSYRKPFAA